MAKDKGALPFLYSNDGLRITALRHPDGFEGSMPGNSDGTEMQITDAVMAPDGAGEG